MEVTKSERMKVVDPQLGQALVISGLRADLELAQSDLRFARAAMHRLLHGSWWRRLAHAIRIALVGLEVTK